MKSNKGDDQQAHKVRNKEAPDLCLSEVTEFGEHLQIIEKVSADYPNPCIPESERSDQDGAWFARDTL